MTGARRYAFTPVQHIETTWRPPWFVAQAAIHGAEHFKHKAVMGDHHLVGGTAQLTWLIASDGVSRAASGATGSRLACETLELFLGDAIHQQRPPSTALLLEGFRVVHERLQRYAAENQQEPDALACTLSAVLLDGNAVYAASIGDSVIASLTTVGQYDKPASQVLAPFCSPPQLQSPATHVISRSNWRRYTATNESTNPAIRMVLVASDGGQDFFLSSLAQPRHGWNMWWPTYFMDVYAATDARLAGNALAYFLEKEDKDQTDDRTLLLAYRPDHPPAFPAYA